MCLSGTYICEGAWILAVSCGEIGELILFIYKGAMRIVFLLIVLVVLVANVMNSSKETSLKSKGRFLQGSTMNYAHTGHIAVYTTAGKLYVLDIKNPKHAEFYDQKTGQFSKLTFQPNISVSRKGKMSICGEEVVSPYNRTPDVALSVYAHQSCHLLAQSCRLGAFNVAGCQYLK